MRRGAGGEWKGGLCAAALLGLLLAGRPAAAAEAPVPVLNTVFPAGAAAGKSTEVALGGSLEGVRALHCSAPGVQCQLLAAGKFRVTVPAGTPPGQYDLWAAGDTGVTATRTFCIGVRPEQVETEPNDATSTAQAVPLNSVVNGRIEQAGDRDCYRFEAKRGQRVLIECWAERIDSRLRAVPELFDAAGHRLAVSYGYFGVDPLIDFRVPADGAYVVRVQDLVSSGSPEHYYRLSIGTGPRVAFTVPAVVQRGKATRVTLYGWNLGKGALGAKPGALGYEPATPKRTALQPAPKAQGPTLNALQALDVEIPAAMAREAWPLPVGLRPAQVALGGFSYVLPGSDVPVVVGVTDVPVVRDRPDNHSSASAQPLAYPCEVSGQLAVRDERDWYAVSVHRGEVLYLEALGERIGSPVDLQLGVLDPSGERELAQFGDETGDLGGSAFPTRHLDPSGRWVAPADGRYLIVVRNLTGGTGTDPRRVYRLSVRREEPDFQLVAVPPRDEPASVTLRKGGSELLDVLAFRRRGMTGAIRVSARDLPPGVDCPDVWLGPGVNRATLVVRAERGIGTVSGELRLEGTAEGVGTRPVRGGAVVRAGLPNPWGRLVSTIPLAVAGEAPVRVTADAHETLDHHLYGTLQVRHAPGSVVDVAIRVDRRDAAHPAPVTLIGVGLPDGVANQTAVIPAGESRGHVSFFLPPTLPLGHYSLAVRAETTALNAQGKPEPVVTYSNPVGIEVRPAAFVVEVDPYAPTRVKRGETIQIRYSALRRNGFIGKIHTELAAPGVITDVVGVRGRGETFVGQSDRGSLQVVINPDAPLGRVPFLRLFSVGSVEDEPVFQGACFLNLEIVE